MKFEFYEELSPEDTEYLWGQDVCMDDWDYLVITHDIDQFEEREEEEDYGYDSKIMVKRLYPRSWTLERLLNGCCDNRWQKLIWNNREAVIGIAYHA